MVGALGLYADEAYLCFRLQMLLLHSLEPLQICEHSQMLREIRPWLSQTVAKEKLLHQVVTSRQAQQCQMIPSVGTNLPLVGEKTNKRWLGRETFLQVVTSRQAQQCQLVPSVGCQGKDNKRWSGRICIVYSRGPDSGL